MSLIEKRPETTYRCTQAELYVGLGIVWDSQAENETRFMSENTKYTPGLAADKKLAILAAQALPDGQARAAKQEVFRIRLVEIHDVVIGLWNSLDGYIRRAYKGAEYATRIEEAGKGYYDRAYSTNWEYVVMLMQSAKNFLGAHEAVLVGKGGMPAGYVANFDAKRDEFVTTYGLFKDAQQDSQQETDVKILANNVVYKDGREMMEDGKHIFRKEPSLRDRFIWERILELVSPQTGGGGTPPAPVEKIIITMSTVQNPADKVTLGFKGEAGKLVNTAFGDGNEKSSTMDGIDYVLAGNTYLTGGNYTITAEAEKSSLDGIVASGDMLTAVNHPDGLDAEEYDYSNNMLGSIYFLPTNGRAKKIDVSNNGLDQQSINLLLMTANGWGTNDGYIDASGGTNAAPSGQGIAAMNQLIARGWTVVTN